MRYILSSWTTPFSLLVLCLLSVGCSTIHYQITLKPDGDAIERTLVCWQESKDPAGKLEDFPKDRLSEIAGVYGAELPKKLKQKHTFKGRFVGEMPTDLDNSGTFTKWHSPFGTVSAYSERFGGTDDIAAQIKALEGAANRTVDLIIAWLDSELASEPKWKELRPIIDTKVRRDLANLCHTLLLAVGGFDLGQLDSGSKEPDPAIYSVLSNIALRMTQYLVEHGYIEVVDIPLVMRAFSDVDNEFTNQCFSSLIQKWIKKQLKMGNSESLPSSFDFLTRRESMAESFERYLKTTPEFKLLKEKQGNELENGERFDAFRVITPIVGGDDALLKDMALTLMPLKDGREIEVALHCSVRPITTNGRWNEAEKQIRWQTLKQGSFGLSPMMEAIWAEPNVEEQRKRFGSVVLTEAKLGAYAIWYAGLSKDEAKEWGSFVETWKPGPELIRSIELFRFTFDQPIERINGKLETPQSLADTPRDIIVEALKKQREGRE